jgi:hypothetical protein
MSGESENKLSRILDRGICGGECQPHAPPPLSAEQSPVPLDTLPVGSWANVDVAVGITMVCDDLLNWLQQSVSTTLSYVYCVNGVQ